jgi:hypothetical protein
MQQTYKPIDDYVICRHVIGSPARVNSDKQEYDACEQAVARLIQICDVEEKYESFIETYVEWEAAINQLALRQMVMWSFDHIQVAEARKLLARRLANLLASARLYVDTLPKDTKAVLSDNVRDQIKSALAREYDAHLAYRVLEALRNHAQHSALPIHGITTHSRWHREEEPHSMSVTVWPRIDLQQLEDDRDFKRSVLNELKALEKIELKPMVRQYIESISRVHKEFRQATEQAANDWLAQLEQSKARYTNRFPDEETLALCVLPVDTRGFEAGEPVYVAGPLPKYFTHMRSKYSAMMNFAKRRVDF